MPLVNIQKMWKAFNSQATFENSVAENDNDEIDLSILLDAKICKKSLIFSNGLYTLIEWKHIYLNCFKRNNYCIVTTVYCIKQNI